MPNQISVPCAGALLAFAILPATGPGQASAAESYALAMHGAPALPADFTAMPYANPDAPKGGRLVQGILGTFDSLNPLIVRGIAVQPIVAVQQMRGLVIESLMARGNDEAFTLYGLLARSVETDDARSYVTFHIDPKARFSDGRPVTSEDVLFSWALLRDHGRPNHRQFYSKVAKAEAPILTIVPPSKVAPIRRLRVFSRRLTRIARLSPLFSSSPATNAPK